MNCVVYVNRVSISCYTIPIQVLKAGRKKYDGSIHATCRRVYLEWLFAQEDKGREMAKAMVRGERYLLDVL